MHQFLDLFPVVESRIEAPVLIVLGSPWPVTQLVRAIGPRDITCFQMDLFPAARLREKLAQERLTAEVVTAPDLWDLPARFRTILFPATAHSDRDLKLDMLEQGFHILEEGGLFITLSEYEKDVQFARWHKKIFGKCGESPRSKVGMAFWSAKHGEQPRRRHQIVFHARIGDRPSMSFASWPGTFGYGRMDNGSRAMLEVAELGEGNHVLDLGCGNGTVGCLASQAIGPTGRVTFIDSNVRAVRLSEENVKTNNVSNAEFVASADLSGLNPDGYDVILANPPYYANSEVARMFILTARDLLKRGGRFHLVTKMPVQTIPEVVETFGDAESVENRGYTILTARL